MYVYIHKHVDSEQTSNAHRKKSPALKRAYITNEMAEIGLASRRAERIHI